MPTCRALLIVGIALLSTAVSAIAEPNLAVIAAKTAAAIKQTIPGSEAEMQGTTSVVKKRTFVAPDLTVQGGHAMDTGKRSELPDGYGIMVVVKLFHHGQYSGAALPSTPDFNPRQARKIRMLLRGCSRTTTLQHYAEASAVIDVLFGDYVDQKLLERAYLAGTRTLRAELGIPLSARPSL
ncbi:MAG: hypothetical protein ACJ8IQ_10935 [Chthoniobacterales bacterium]